jgi:hypothetical protein
MTAHNIAAMAEQESLPVRVRDAIDQRAAARRDPGCRRTKGRCIDPTYAPVATNDIC